MPYRCSRAAHAGAVLARPGVNRLHKQAAPHPPQPAHGQGASSERPTYERYHPIMLTLLIIALILAMLLSAPRWPYSRGWGYYPSGGLGLVLVLLLLFVFLRPI